MQRTTSTPEPRQTFRWRAVLGWGFLAVLLVAVIVALAGYRAAKVVPDFYAQALEPKLPPAEAKAAADSAEREILAAQNSVERARDWQLVLREQQINSWLATQLVEKMPNLLPKQVQDPRVKIEGGLIRVACRYEGDVSGVLALSLEPSMSAEPNTVAIRLRSLTLGMLPLPRKKFLDEITKGAAKAKLPLRWADDGGDPLAIVSIPPEHEGFKSRILHIDGLEVREGELELRGRAEKR